MIIHIKNILLCTMVFLFVIFFSSIAYCQAEAQVSIPFEIYDNTGGQKILYFGLDQTATNGIDFLLGESDLPPYPPTGAFDVRWILPENGFNGSFSSWLDYRNAPGFPYSGTVEHRFRYQSMLGTTEMYFKWNLPDEITGLVQDLINGTFINVPIAGSGTYQINNFEVFNQLKLFVYYNNIVADAANESVLPSEFKLEQNYPNPFNPTTIISFQLPVSCVVTLTVYDVLGNEVAILINGEKPAGIYEVEFSSHSNESANGGQNLPAGRQGLSNHQGSALTSGIYFYQLRVNNSSKLSGQSFVQSKKMILLK
ncbi:MAG: hypothetical protein HND39_15825 [Ignavibacteriota bacterium]|nr:MAG: hypothetical protein HND39_15825 [Ignavibacteriota bacterium]